MRIAVALIAVLVAGSGSAQPQPGQSDDGLTPQRGLKKSNPEQLVVDYIIGELCPVTKISVQAAVEGVFIRARIKPLPFPATVELPDGERLMLYVVLRCTGPSFRTDINFIGSENGSAVRYGLFGYDNSGLHGNDAQSLLNLVQRDVERAVTDYLKVNFDL